jgi:hypothetical protein
MDEVLGKNGTEKDEIFSKVVRAGKRTYFFDVKSTRGNDYYITITESKKRFGDDGKFSFEKHKIFLYKEDFEKFSEGFKEVVDYIKTTSPLVTEDHRPERKEALETKSAGDKFSDVDFEDI